MGMNCGIVGLPNVGKSTIFQALTSTPTEAANYPFCTIEPNLGIVNVPDERLDRICKIIPSKRKVPATVEFVDIAGLVEGASQGEGLGNQFLSHVRNVGVLCHVVRCFDDEDVVHVGGLVAPVSDIETINTELALADLDTVERRLEKLPRLLRSPDKETVKEARFLEPLLLRLKFTLGQAFPARSESWEDEERSLLGGLHLLTMKEQIFVCNVDEDGLEGESPYVKEVRKAAGGDRVIVICGKLEAEIAALETEEERAEFLQAVGLAESGLSRLIRAGYEALGMRTFFTAGADENRAWTFLKGALAPEAAGVIHTDFQRGFIKAEVFHCGDLFELGSENAIRKAGKLRMEGKTYPVKDGDVLFFKFNV